MAHILSQPHRATSTGAASSSRPIAWRTIIAGSVGNTVEWFDWTVYTAFALYFSHQFFPSDNETTALLASFAVFAIGFAMRPLGGWLIGIFNDRAGRKAALNLTILMMALPSLLISLMPTYATIGIAAPVLMVLARMVQGLSVGGEYGAAATFLAESAPAGQRGLYSGFFFASIALGLLFASGLAWALSQWLSRDQLIDFGWRIPFFIGGLGSLAGFWIRHGVEETAAFRKGQEQRHGQRVEQPLRTLWRDHPEAVKRLVGISLLGAFAFYLFVSYLPVHAIRTLGVAPGTAYAASSLALVVFMISQPLFGWLSDRIGRRPQLIVFALGYAALLYPVVRSMNASFASILAVELFGLLLYGLYSAIAPAIKSELFSTDIRALGIGLPYNLVVAIFGGTTPYLMTWLQSRGQEQWFLVYVSVMALITLVAFVRMPETRGKDLH
ncbi:MFS transporter [Pseudomonas nitroreducens]|uniref:MFS transporter n=1 Tax=Pseudomonas nitroreducens TaxID=46680 RepID=UPI0020A206E2|nr:MFS transporter [Pseudomonas nitroreducens]MCP1625158.1 MHS family alpha-ketoglutarate permease-like MFS transporter [Pseudomonas nitroreducens]